MARGIDRTDIFIDAADRTRFLGIIEELVDKTGTKIPAWSIMSNHFHLLVLSGPSGLPAFMRRLMTRYAVYFNRTHHRTGHLFQNRYKSVVCEEELYFLELVRYIHLNPLRAGIVASLTDLDVYPWCGHSTIMGKTTRVWQDRMRVIAHFSTSVARGIRFYRAFVNEGKDRGKQPILTGGGLRRSLGGATPSKDERAAFDERVLGSSDFVTRILNETEHSPHAHVLDKHAVIDMICEDLGVRREQLRNGSRRRRVCKARARIIEELVNGSGVSLAEVARLVGVSPSGVANTLKRAEKKRK